MATNLETPFAKAIASNIRAKVTELKSDGTTGMSPDNLCQVVRTPSSGLAGAPVGANAPYAYRQLFREVLSSLRLSRFQLL